MHGGGEKGPFLFCPPPPHPTPLSLPLCYLVLSQRIQNPSRANGGEKQTGIREVAGGGSVRSVCVENCLAQDAKDARRFGFQDDVVVSVLCSKPQLHQRARETERGDQRARRLLMHVRECVRIGVDFYAECWTAAGPVLLCDSGFLLLLCIFHPVRL